MGEAAIRSFYEDAPLAYAAPGATHGNRCEFAIIRWLVTALSRYADIGRWVRIAPLGRVGGRILRWTSERAPRSLQLRPLQLKRAGARSSWVSWPSEKKDKLGNRIVELLWVGSQYAIYRSEKGVYVHFSDCPEEEKKQRAAFTEICPQLCELRYLTSQMSDSSTERLFSWLQRLLEGVDRRASGRALYEHNIAQALMLLMEGKSDDAKKIAKQALDMAVRRVTNDNTIRYVAACLAWGVIWAAFGSLFAMGLSQLSFDVGSQLMFASVFGAAGAVFSIISRFHAFEMSPCQESGMNYWMSAMRVCMGIISGVVLVLLASTVVGHPISNMVQLQDGNDGGATARMSWQVVALLGFVGGFAERLIPRLLQKTVEKAEVSYGTPVQAAMNANTSGAKSA